jgi:hypothetical protein
MLDSIKRMDPDLAQAAKAVLTCGNREKIVKTMTTIAEAQAERYHAQARAEEE